MCEKSIGAICGIAFAAVHACDAASTQCDEPGHIFLATGPWLQTNDAGSLTLTIQGPLGEREFSFASGTSQVNIIAALDAFHQELGVTARQSVLNPARVEIASDSTGATSFVSARQSTNAAPIIFAGEIRGAPSYELKQRGRDALPGDADCDRTVNHLDLLAVIAHWGVCPSADLTCVGELTGDGAVDVRDLLEVINNWGRSDP